MNEQQALKYLTTVFKSLSAIIIANKFIALVLVLIGLIAQWIVFVKAGRKGWETLIPIYKDVIAIQTFWGIGKIVRTFIFTLVAIILLYVGTTTMNRTVFIIGFGCFIPLVLFYPTYVYKKPDSSIRVSGLVSVCSFCLIFSISSLRLTKTVATALIDSSKPSDMAFCFHNKTLAEARALHRRQES